MRVANLSTIWTVTYTQPSRYNWMLQYYLRAEGLALSWVGTGRFIFSLNYSEADFQAVADRFVAAVRAMHGDGFWWSAAHVSNESIKRVIVREMIHQRLDRNVRRAAWRARSSRPAAEPAAPCGTA